MIAASEGITHDYLGLLEYVVINIRHRIRYEDDITLREIHDLLDAVHNIPEMLRSCAGWHVPENIDPGLAYYDSKWLGKGKATFRKSLMETLRRVRAGDYDHPASPNTGQPQSPLSADQSPADG